MKPLDLFFDQLRDLHSVEVQLLDSLPLLSARAADAELHSLIADHAEETQIHLEIICGIFKQHGAEVGEDKCKAMEGLIAGGDKHLDSVAGTEISDLMLIAHCLRIEYYEAAAYTITCRLAEQLGLKMEAQLLGQSLAQEQKAGSRLELLEPRIFAAAGAVLQRC